MKKPIGRPFASITACGSVFMPPFVLLGGPALPFAKAERRAVGSEIGRVGHDRLVIGSLRCRRTFHPPLPAIIAGDALQREDPDRQLQDPGDDGCRGSTASSVIAISSRPATTTGASKTYLGLCAPPVGMTNGISDIATLLLLTCVATISVVSVMSFPDLPFPSPFRFGNAQTRRHDRMLSPFKSVRLFCTAGFAIPSKR